MLKRVLAAMCFLSCTQELSLCALHAPPTRSRLHAVYHPCPSTLAAPAECHLLLHDP